MYILTSKIQSLLRQIYHYTCPNECFFQVYVAAIRNRKLILPEDSTQLYEIERDKEVAAEDDFLPHRNIYRFLT